VGLLQRTTSPVALIAFGVLNIAQHVVDLRMLSVGQKLRRQAFGPIFPGFPALFERFRMSPSSLFGLYFMTSITRVMRDMHLIDPPQAVSIRTKFA
jgi:hypothetical protein